MSRATPVLLSLLVLAGCSALPDRPQRPAQYDFGPGPVPTAAAPAGRSAPLPPLALAEVEASGPLEAGTAVLYRLGYADDRQLRPYALARWSMPPAQLVRQRVREQLGQHRTIVGAGEGAAMLREGGRQPTVLRLELEEFSQLFGSPVESFGLLRLRATLVDNLPAGERVLAQRQLIVQRPAPTPDAAGGVRALAEATDAAAADLAQWLETAQP
ncbi:ABC-type transport auxiliary lipoprotein family protein [Pseudorhodoferax sp.]|uniref:ABC-type transport auxiliary lipoprotein family protein n=1 Tax=Pseudorhodoferax sp. TaxID=1993553 RepID=UPI0039E62724